MSSDRDPDREEIRAIVEDVLEERADGGSLPVSRRGLLKGGAAAGIGAAGAGLFGAGSGAAQSGASSGQVGMSDRRVDVYGDLIDANTVSADKTRSTEINNRIYASEVLSHLPSIQEGISMLDNTEDIQSLEVVGGWNIINETIQIPEFGGYGRGGEIRIISRGENVITQADGAELDAIIRNDTNTVVNLDVQINANSSNNSTSVTGIEQNDIGSRGEITGYVKDADVGLDIVDTSETQKVDIYCEDCGIGVRERVMNAGQNADENQLNITGRNNATHDYHHPDGGNSSVRLNSEQCGSQAAMVEGGRVTFVGGVIRGSSQSAIRVEGGRSTVTGLYISPGGVGFNVHSGASGPCHIKSTIIRTPGNDGISFNDTDGTVSGCSVIDGDAYGIRASGADVDVKQTDITGNASGATVTSGTDPTLRTDAWTDANSQA